MSRTCLVVDDSRVVRRAARRILEDAGFAVQEAENGQLALEACRESKPDMVLLDWNMPVMNGIECLHALRAEFGDNLPVVFCTTETEIDRIEQALDGGALEYIMKPFDSDILCSKLAQAGLL
jgi:two-component system chemotaxis response regulator CheY